MENMLIASIVGTFTATFVGWLVSRALKTIPSKDDMNQMKASIFLKLEQDMSRYHEKITADVIQRVKILEKRVDKLEDLILGRIK